MSLTIRSEVFTHGQRIPKRHTGDGEDVSPKLSWEGIPPGTKELALVCDDPDAPTPEPWVHWLIYRIAPATTELAEGIPPKARLDVPAGALQGRNSWSSGRTIGYRGPAPPPGHGVHHYHFKLYALDTMLDASPSLDKRALLRAMEGHILAQAELVGTYER
jgi:hypothetical protein